MSQPTVQPSDQQLTDLVSQLVSTTSPSPLDRPEPQGIPQAVAEVADIKPAPPAVPATGSPWGAIQRLLGRSRPTSAPAPEAPTLEMRPKGVRLQPRRRGSERRLKKEAPAWLVSLLVHGAMLALLGLATLTPEVRKAMADLNSSVVDPTVMEELLQIDAAPSITQSELAASDTVSIDDGRFTSVGPPSNAPMVAVASRPSESTSSTLPKLGPLTPSAIMPPMAQLTTEIGGGLGGGVTGTADAQVGSLEEALDRLAKEILRHLQDHKLTVVWLFDESQSMKDDREVIRDKFGLITNQLDVNVDPELKAQRALLHMIIGFGSRFDPGLKAPTEDMELIRGAIKELPIEQFGKEATFEAIDKAIQSYAVKADDDRRTLVVLVTDESGDDGANVEETRQRAIKANVPLYVLGRQSLFGKRDIVLPYTDPITKDVYWPTIQRGPETAELECLQFDGLHGRWDEQPSGFAPYELARLTKETGGMYFILPTEEKLRGDLFRKERAYSLSTLKEYIPDYESRQAYRGRLEASVLRGNLVDIINITKDYAFRRHFPLEPNALVSAIQSELPKVNARIQYLAAIEKRLRGLEPERDKEPQRRWQAHYDLMLAQITAYQVKAYEYGATLTDMLARFNAGTLVPEPKPIEGELKVEWEINHSKDLKLPPAQTEKQIAEAIRLYNLVIERHPDTPWAHLAQTELDRGFGCGFNTWAHSTRYDENAANVPKY